MNIIYLTVPMALLLGGSFVYAFIKTAMSGQYDDLETPAHRMLFDDQSKESKIQKNTNLEVQVPTTKTEATIDDRSGKEAQK
jgi:cbb3-type cytochrome oxidase maturation protein